MTDVCEFCGRPFAMMVVEEGDCDCADWALAHARQIGGLRRKYVEAKKANDDAWAEYDAAWKAYCDANPDGIVAAPVEYRAATVALQRKERTEVAEEDAENALLALFAEEP